jgi:hypothetical protein
MWTAEDVKKARQGSGKWTADMVKNIRAGNKVNINDPINQLSPLERDRAEQARRSKMGTLKNMSESVKTTVSPPKPNLLQKIGNVAKGAVSALSEGSINVLGNISHFGNVLEEKNPLSLGKALGMKTYADQTERAEQAKYYDNLASGIRSDLGVDPNAMSKTGNFVYNTATNIPSMLAGPAIFGISAAGGYAKEAEEKGATTGQALTHGLIGGGIELGLEQALGAVPGIKNLKNITKGGIKGFIKTAAGEALEEAITDPLIGLSEKAIFNKKLPLYSTTQDAVINPSQMGQSALGGGLMTAMLAPFGLGGNVQQQTQQAPIQAEQQTRPMPIPKKTDFYTDQYGNTAADINASRQMPQAQQEASPTVKPRQESEILQKRRQAEQLRREYEQIKATSKLTPDELTIADNIRKGKLSAVPQGFNAQIINEVANAGRLYDQVQNEIKGYNKKVKAQRLESMNDLIKNSDNWNDKKLAGGLRYSWGTPERNIIDIAGKQDGQKIIDNVFTPIHQNEAASTRAKTAYRERIKRFNLSNKRHGLVTEVEINGQKFKQLTEREAAQMLTEKVITENDLPSSMDKGKVKAAAAELRKSYDELFDMANEVLVRNGYEPVEYRKNYAPHFENPKDPIVMALKSMGFKVDDMTLPTDIAGLTHTFRPGKKWFGNFLRREGTKTDYDALEGFDRYLEGISDVIYHTDDIQRLRALETAIRTKYASDSVKNRIAEIEDSSLTYEEKQSAINDLFNIEKGHLSNYVIDLRKYTDNLAGKQSKGDRNVEDNWGRQILNVIDNGTSLVAKNMVGFNVGSWLTNFIPLVQGGAGIKIKNIVKAAYDTTMSYFNDDGFVNRSTFLTNRKGSEPLTRTTIQKVADAGFKPMQWIDEFTSSIITRAKYLDELERGASPADAIKKADSFAASAIGDRSKGATPTAFNTKSPLAKVFTMFQLEVNNALQFIAKDIPQEAKELGGKWLAATILKFLAGSYLFAEAFKFFTGREPNINPVGTVKRAIEAGTPLDAISAVTTDIAQNTPFIGGFLGGGRLPIQAALPDIPSVIKGDADFGKEMLKPLTYLVSPIGGGGQILGKTIPGIKAFSQGASLSDTGRMRYPIPKTPLNALRTGLFGQYSTPEAREYFDKNRTTLSPNQTQQVMSSQDPQQAYLQIMQQRQIDSLNQKLKEVAADDTLSRAEKDKKINEIRQKINELRN